MLERRDLIFAILLHFAVVISIVVLNQWRAEIKPRPDRVMQVNMVTLAELQAMMDKAKPVSKKQNVQKKVPPKPKQKSKPKPVLNPSKKTRKKVVEEDLDYDPFAPLESSIKHDNKKNEATEEVLLEMLQGQLSDQELNRYIAAMQEAVERNWKVPVEMMDRVKDALVKLELQRNGQVTSITILESSGSDMLDETLKQAIYASAPFNLPVKQFELFRVNIIRFFPLK